jgi:phage FluMu gp28-like protein
MAKENTSIRREAFHASTFDNPYLTEDDRLEIEEEKGSLTEGIWERFYMAKQPEGAGNFFRNITKAYSRGAYEMMGPEDGSKYVAGLDIGRSNDPTVMVIKNRVTRTSVFAFELMKTDWSLQLETIKREAIRWSLEEIYMDSTGLGGKLGEDVLYRELMEHSIPVVGYNFTPSKKYQLFLDYALSLEKENVAFPESWVKLISQLEDIAHRETANRGHQFYSVSNGHDDWVDAECLALMACDPAQDVVDLLTVPRSKRGIKPINSNYRNKSSRLLRWREERKALEEEGTKVL